MANYITNILSNWIIHIFWSEKSLIEVLYSFIQATSLKDPELLNIHKWFI